MSRLSPNERSCRPYWNGVHGETTDSLFRLRARGNPLAMADKNQETTGTSRKATQSTETSGKARNGVKHGVEQAAAKTGSATRAAAGSVVSGGKSLGEATARAGRSASHGAKTGRKKLTSVSGPAATATSAAWTAVKNRKHIAAGIGAGAATAVAASFAAGRYSIRWREGHLTRLTGGRF